MGKLTRKVEMYFNRPHSKVFLKLEKSVAEYDSPSLTLTSLTSRKTL